MESQEIVVVGEAEVLRQAIPFGGTRKAVIVHGHAIAQGVSAVLFAFQPRPGDVFIVQLQLVELDVGGFIDASFIGVVSGESIGCSDPNGAVIGFVNRTTTQTIKTVVVAIVFKINFRFNSSSSLHFY